MNKWRVSKGRFVFSDYTSFQCLLGASIGILVILFSAFAYEHIRNPNIWWIALVGVIGVEICATKVLVDYLGKPKEDSGRVPHLEAPHPASTLPSAPASEPSASPPTPPLTLKELFDTDFPTGGVTNTVTLKSRKDGPAITVPFFVVTDFIARTKFIAFYVPSFPDIFAVCCSLPHMIRVVFETTDKSIEIKTTDSVNTPTALKDLAFTGRIYIYYEDDLSFQQLATIQAAFSEQNVDVQFRGPAYLALHRHEKRELRNPMTTLSVPEQTGIAVRARPTASGASGINPSAEPTIAPKQATTTSTESPAIQHSNRGMTIQPSSTTNRSPVILQGKLLNIFRGYTDDPQTSGLWILRTPINALSWDKTPRFYPIGRAIFVEITNRGTEPFSLASYSTACTNKYGAWEDMKSFPVLDGNAVYNAYDVRNGFNHAAHIFFDGFLAFEIIRPNQVVKGWILISAATNGYSDNFKLKFWDASENMELVDLDKIGGTVQMPTFKNIPWQGGGSITTKEDVDVDMSKVARVIYFP
jgi:hypothetical protein